MKGYADLSPTAKNPDGRPHLARVIKHQFLTAERSLADARELLEWVEKQQALWFVAQTCFDDGEDVQPPLGATDEERGAAMVDVLNAEKHLAERFRYWSAFALPVVEQRIAEHRGSAWHRLYRLMGGKTRVAHRLLDDGECLARAEQELVELKGAKHG